MAAHALVASFLGATAIRAHGPDAWGWIALAALALGLIAAAALLAPWQISFAMDARALYDGLYVRAQNEAESKALGWLVEAAFSYQDVCTANAVKVRRMSVLSGALGVLMVVQAIAWLATLA